jgi:hypothetical protein
MIVNPYINLHDIAYYLFRNLILLTETAGTIPYLAQAAFSSRLNAYADNRYAGGRI